MKAQYGSTSASSPLRVLMILFVVCVGVLLAGVAISALSNTRVQTKPQQSESPEKDENPAARMAWERLRLQDEHGQIAPGALRRAYEHKNAMPFRPEAWAEFLPANSSGQPAAVQSIWTSIGPGNIGGRTRSIIIHPTNPSIAWLGAVGGGVWKTTDGGTSWSTTTDFLSNLAVDCMVMDPTNSNVLYVGTGEPWYPHDGIQGDGIFKTTDGGSTWTQLSSTADNPDFYYVTRLAAWYNSSLRRVYLLATTTTGIFRSTSGGAQWTRVMTGQWNTVVFRPDNGYCLASREGGDVFYSTDLGTTWAQSGILNSPTPITGRTELAYARSDPRTVYASASTLPPPYPPPGWPSGALFKSTDGRGASFNFTGVQGTLYYVGSFMNTLWVDPTNPNTILVGGLDLYRSTDGGASVEPIDEDRNCGVQTGADAHADHHVVINDPNYANNKKVYIGTDGGIYSTANVLASKCSLNWTSLNHTLGITQFYGGAATSDGGTIIGGTQDNGTLRYQGDPEDWTRIMCGDGGMCAVGGAYFYGEIPTLGILRSDGSFQCPPNSGQYITGTSPNNLNDALCDACGNWASPLLLDPNNANRLLVGGLKLWRSNNPSDPPGSVSWASIKPGPDCPRNNCSGPPGGDKISAMTVAIGNSDIIWVGHDSGALYYTTNGTATSPNWTAVQSPVSRYCGGIAFGPRPAEYNRIYVAFGGYSSGNLWKSTDSGQTWTDISNGLPSVPINSVATRWSAGYHLYIGTAVGVFASVDDGATWSPGIAGDVPANVFVDQLFWANGTRLVAVTHGRGMFTADIQGTQ